jgi:hypothetical protein
VSFLAFGLLSEYCMSELSIMAYVKMWAGSRARDMDVLSILIRFTPLNHVD